MIAVPGLTPRSPLITVEPVLVTVEPPRTPKSPAVNKSMVVCAWPGDVSAAPIRPNKTSARASPANFSGNVGDKVEFEYAIAHPTSPQWAGLWISEFGSNKFIARRTC